LTNSSIRKVKLRKRSFYHQFLVTCKVTAGDKVCGNLLHIILMKKIFDLQHIKGDLFGGITAGIVALPLALAFGVQSGMGAIAGLYGAMILGMFAAVLGGTATQVSGPTGPMTVITAMVVASAIEASGSLQAGMGIIIASFLLAGGFQIVFGIVKIGKYIKYIPYPVLSGFMTGIGVIIILWISRTENINQ